MRLYYFWCATLRNLECHKSVYNVQCTACATNLHTVLTVLCRSLDSCTYIRILEQTNEKQEQLHHHSNDILYSSLTGQSEIWVFLHNIGLSDDLQSSVGQRDDTDHWCYTDSDTITWFSPYLSCVLKEEWEWDLWNGILLWCPEVGHHHYVG